MALPVTGWSDTALTSTAVRVQRAARARFGRRVFRLAATLLAVSSALAGCQACLLSSLRCDDQDRARNQAFEIAKSAELFKIQVGGYPDRLDELAAPPPGLSRIMQRVPRDPWGREYSYLRPGLRNTQKFDIASAGEDGLFYTQDDVGNWPGD